MYHRNPFFIQAISTMLCVREGEGEGAEGGGSGSGAGSSGTDTAAMIAAAVAEATKGLKAKNDELLGAQKSLKEKLKTFDGLDPEKVKGLMERLDQDDDAKLLAEGKKNVVIEKYTERMRAQHQADLAAKDEAIKAADARANTYRQSVLDNEIRAVTTGLHKGAVDDALLHARQIFSLDDKGRAVKLDAEGNPELGKDGKNPFSPAEWIEQQKELKPHWFPSSTTGSGSGNSKSGVGGTGKTIKRAEFDSLSPMKQGELIRGGTKLVD